MDVGATDEMRHFVQRIAAAQTLRAAGTALAAADVRAVVLKGAWLLAEVYPSEDLRPTTDVDLLVAPTDFARSQQALSAWGFRPQTRDPRQVALQRSDLALAVDLHQALFPAGSFRLASAAVLCRAREGAPHGLRWPDPLDGLAHLIGHFANNRVMADNLARREDFERIGTRFALQPDTTARHLVRVGMARAARYALGAVLDSTDRPWPFCASLLAALPADPVGHMVARLCRRAIPRTPATHPLGALLCCMLEANLGRALWASVARPAERVRHRFTRSGVEG